MKLVAYQVREDEHVAFERLAQKYNIDIEVTTVPLTLETVNLAKGAQGISMPGGCMPEGAGNAKKELLDAIAAQGIQALATRSIGYNHIDVEYANHIGIKVCNSDYAPNGVSEYTVMLMLIAIRRFKETLQRTQADDYSIQGLKGKELKDLTVGIIGTGQIGQSVIRNLSGFGCDILAYDINVDPNIQMYAHYVSWNEVISQSDIISLHLPLNKETYHLINKDEVAKMKDDVILINCSRGELMETNALIDGIESEKIGALGLDVIEGEFEFFRDQEDEDIKHLTQFENVILTPHVAFYTDVAVMSMVERSVEGLMALIQNQEWRNAI